MTQRATLAFLIAPLVAALLYALLASISGGNETDSGPLYFLVATLRVYVYAGIFTALLAVPAFLILNRLRLLRWWSAIVSGAVVGLVFAALFSGPNARNLQGRLILALIGGISGLAFWLIWRPVTPPNSRQTKPIALVQISRRVAELYVENAGDSDVLQRRSVPMTPDDWDAWRSISVLLQRLEIGARGRASSRFAAQTETMLAAFVPDQLVSEWLRSSAESLASGGQLRRLTTGYGLLRQVGTRKDFD
jgi:hypothetical protein